MAQSDNTALSVIKAGISAVPVLGGPLASLIGDHVQAATQASQELAIRLLKQRLEQFKDRIDIDKVDKDEFAELFKSCYLVIVRSHKKDKLQAAANLITNILLIPGDRDKLQFTELDHFIRALDGLSLHAIEVLAAVYDMQTHDGRRDVFHGNTKLTFAPLSRKLAGDDPHLLMGLLGELNSFNLVHLTGTPRVREPDYGNYSIEFTPLGAKFVCQVLRWGEKTAQH